MLKSRTYRLTLEATRLWKQRSPDFGVAAALVDLKIVGPNLGPPRLASDRLIDPRRHSSAETASAVCKVR